MSIENGINYALRVLKPVLEGKASVACVKRSAEESYVDRLQAALQKTVWTTGCNSWYVRGPGGKIWNGMTYPWSQAYYWYESLFPVWRDWEYSVSGFFLLMRVKWLTGIEGQNIQVDHCQAPARQVLVS